MTAEKVSKPLTISELLEVEVAIAHSIRELIHEDEKAKKAGDYEKVDFFSRSIALLLSAKEKVKAWAFGKDANKLNLLFGKSASHEEPAHLLGASLCLLSANAEYTADLNPYPASSPHHAGVEIGWRMARAAITGETTVLPGTL